MLMNVQPIPTVSERINEVRSADGADRQRGDPPEREPVVGAAHEHAAHAGRHRAGARAARAHQGRS